MQFHGIVFKLCSNALYVRVVSILEKQEGGLTGRSLASLTKASTFKMHHTLKFMVAQGVLKESVVGRAHLYRLNRDHVLTQEIILPLVIFQESLLTRLGQDIASYLRPKPLSIILYGSVARGDEYPTSDLDMFILYGSPQKAGRISENNLWMEMITRKYGNALSVRRSVLSEFITRHREGDKLIRSVFREGKVIYGLSFVDMLDHDRKGN